MKNIKNIRTSLILLLILFHLNACGNKDMKKYFVKEVEKNSTFTLGSVDSLTKDSIIFILPQLTRGLLKSVIDSDIDKTTKNNIYANSIVTYNIMKSTDNLISVIKSIYMEDEGSPRGFFAWDECLNYYQFSNQILKINYEFDTDFSAQLNYLKEIGKLDIDCIGVELKEKDDLLFYIRDSNIFLHNPISSPFCNVDVRLTIDTSKIYFLNSEE